MQTFARLMPDGDLRLGTLDDLVAEASEGGLTPITIGNLAGERTGNPPARLTVAQAFAKCGLPEMDLSEILRIPVRTAADRLRYPLFDKFHELPEGMRKDRPGVMTSDSKLSDLFLRANAKMEKVNGMNIEGYGLMLEPHHLTFGASPPSGSAEIEEWRSRARGEDHTEVQITTRDERGPLMAWEELGVLPERAAKLRTGTSCAGSSADCRNTCLLSSGQNWSDQSEKLAGRTVDRSTPYLRSVPYNRALKKVLSTAFLAYPAESARLLLYALERYQRSARAGGLELTVRLNVLSDFPWEMIIPGLFLRGQRPSWFEDSPIHFYDYTKVPGRMPDPMAYHLVYSFSGSNWDSCRDELQRRNVVIPIVGVGEPRPGEQKIQGVFQSYRRNPVRGTGKKQSMELLQLPGFVELPGAGRLPLIDGDQYDARWADPIRSGAIIGLRFKLPNNTLVNYDVAKMAFILKVRQLGDLFVVEQTPGLTNATFGRVDPTNGEQVR